MKPFLLALSVLLFSTSAWTQEGGDDPKSCTPVDLSKSPGLEAPLNRDGTGWCYAFSAADLVSYKVKQRVSAFDIAMQFHDSIQSSFIKRLTHVKTKHVVDSGGNIEEALEAASGAKLCAEKDLPSDYSSNDLYKYVKKVEALTAKDINTPACESARKVYPSLLAEDMKKIITEYRGEERTIEMALASCKKRISIPKIQFKSVTVSKDPDLKGIDEQLNKKNILSFDHDPDFFFQGPRYSPPRMTYDHSATIVGRRFKDGRCEYMIKGSSGRDKNYRYAKPYKENNSGGYVWVERETLKKFTEKYTYVE